VENFPEMLGKQVKLRITERIKSGKYNFNEIIKTSRQSDIYKNIILTAFDFDNIEKLTLKDIEKNTSTGASYAKSNIGSFRKDLSIALDKSILNSDLYKKLILNIESEIAPLVDAQLLAANAISGLFANLKPSIVKIIGSAMDKCLIFNLLAKCNYEEKTDLQKIYIEALQSDLLKMVLQEDRELYAKVFVSFDPVWKLDHGFVSSLIYLGNLELVYNITKLINNGEVNNNDMKLLNLIFFSNSNNNYKDMENEILLCAEICFRSILLHNFYPKDTEELKSFSHDINSNPFTYFSVLCDGLQDWGREVQYNPGVKDFKDFKPDNFYDLEVTPANISVFIDKDYINDNKLTELKANMSSYLRNLNSFVTFERR
jgi:hypothetical protein